MVSPQVEVGGGDCPDTPLGLGGERLTLVVAGCRGDDFVAVLVDGACRGGGQLRLLLRLLLDLGNLLPLSRRCRDLHAQDDVSDLRLGQGGHVHTEHKHVRLFII